MSLHINPEPDSAKMFEEALRGAGADVKIDSAVKDGSGGFALSVNMGGKSYNITLDKELVDGFGADKQTWAKQIAASLQAYNSSNAQSAKFDFKQHEVTWDQHAAVDFKDPDLGNKVAAKFDDIQAHKQQITKLEAQHANVSDTADKDMLQTSIEALRGNLSKLEQEHAPLQMSLLFNQLVSLPAAREVPKNLAPPPSLSAAAPPAQAEPTQTEATPTPTRNAQGPLVGPRPANVSEGARALGQARTPPRSPSPTAEEGAASAPQSAPETLDPNKPPPTIPISTVTSRPQASNAPPPKPLNNALLMNEIIDIDKNQQKVRAVPGNLTDAELVAYFYWGNPRAIEFTHRGDYQDRIEQAMERAEELRRINNR